MEQEQATELQLTLQFIQNIARQAMLVKPEQARAVLSEINRTETLLPMLDPTAWLRGAIKHSDEHKEVVNAFLQFRLVLEKYTGSEDE